MANRPISGEPYAFTLSLFSQSTGSIVQNPSVESDDFQISTDGGAFTPLTSTPTVTPAGGYAVEFNLTSAEVGNDHFCVLCIDSADDEWKSIAYHEVVGAASGGGGGGGATAPAILNAEIVTVQLSGDIQK